MMMDGKLLILLNCEPAVHCILSISGSSPVNHFPSEIIKRGENLLVRADDTLLGEPVEMEADLVVLAAGVVPRQDAEVLAKELNVNLGEDGYFLEDHPKMRVVESSMPGVFLAGCCQGPKDIPDTVAHAKAAAAAAIVLLAREKQPAETVSVA
jgi:heterodisulfide reductase subunit A